MTILSNRLIARAKTSTRKRRVKKDKDNLLSKLVNSFNQPIDGTDGTNGKDGRDAPTLEDILSKVTPMLPEPRIEVTEKTIIEKIDSGDLEDIVEAMLQAKIPEIKLEDRPPVEQITIDVSDDKLDGFVTKKDFDKALIRIQRAITSHSGGGGSRGDLANVIQVSEDTTISSNQLLSERYNIILIMVAGITVTLPIDNGTKVIEIKQGFTGTGTYTVCKQQETS